MVAYDKDKRCKLEKILLLGDAISDLPPVCSTALAGTEKLDSFSCYLFLIITFLAPIYCHV